MKKEILEKVLKTRKNLIVEGEVLSGKTTNVLFPIVNDMIDKKESLFILDSKEEYINQYYNKLKDNNYNIIILNLRDMEKSEGWNPLEYPYTLFKNGDVDKAQEYLEKVGKALFYDDSKQDQFWSEAASDFFIGIALGLFEDGKLEEVNFNSIINMFNGVERKYGSSDYITYYFKSKDVLSKPYIFASTTFLAPKDTRGGILATARQKLRLYASREKLAYLMNKTTFRIENIINKPTAIILIARDETTYLNPLVSMFIEQLYMILTDFKNNNQFNFILDNFDIIEKCNDLVDILCSCLARKIKLFIATRSLNELTDKYGKYILKLCDLISIENSNLKINIDSIEEILEKEFENVSIKEVNIEYPKLSSDKIQLFDLERFVEEHSFSKKQDLKGSFDSKKTINIKELIKEIDDKLEKIDAQEKLDEKRKKENEYDSESKQINIENN